MRTGAIIVAAGAGRRMGGTDKVFAPVAGKPVLVWVVEAFQSCRLIDEIVLVLAGENLSQGREMVLNNCWSKVSNVCPGGPRRQDSASEGLRHLGSCDLVAVHDGARPCIRAEVIERGVREATLSGAAVAAVPVADTIKRVNDHGEVIETLVREGLWDIQTPQIFRREFLEKAYRDNEKDVTDDAALVERAGHKVKVYMASYRNIKITTPEDLALAEWILKERR